MLTTDPFTMMTITHRSCADLHCQSSATHASACFARTFHQSGSTADALIAIARDVRGNTSLHNVLTYNMYISLHYNGLCYSSKQPVRFEYVHSSLSLSLPIDMTVTWQWPVKCVLSLHRLQGASTSSSSRSNASLFYSVALRFASIDHLCGRTRSYCRPPLDYESTIVQ